MFMSEHNVLTVIVVKIGHCKLLPLRDAEIFIIFPQDILLHPKDPSNLHGSWRRDILKLEGHEAIFRLDGLDIWKRRDIVTNGHIPYKWREVILVSGREILVTGASIIGQNIGPAQSHIELLEFGHLQHVDRAFEQEPIALERLGINLILHPILHHLFQHILTICQQL